MTAGVAVARAGARWYAWAGVAVTGVLDPRRLAGYAGLPQEQRLAQAHRADTGYLARLVDLPPGTALDYRWLADGAGRVRLVLLGVAGGADADQAAAGAMVVRDRLARLPDHVLGEPVPDVDALLRLLRPFEPAAAADIVRRPLTGLPGRPDAHVPRYVMVQRCGWHPDRWPRLLEALAANPAPALLSVGLEPWRAPRQLLEVLDREAHAYSRLAQESSVPGAGLVGRTTLRVEPFAEVAAPLYQDAVHRYAGPVFRVRVTLAAAAPLPGALAGAALAALATPDPAGCAAVPHLGADLARAAERLEGLGVAAPPPDSAHLLASIADPAETAAYCPFPLAAGPLPLLDPPPDRLAGGVHVAGDWVQGDKHGDTILTGGKHVYGAGE